jgi:hypothetical protein
MPEQLNGRLVFADGAIASNEAAVNFGERASEVASRLFRTAVSFVREKEEASIPHTSSISYETIQPDELTPPPLVLLEAKKLSLNNRAYNLYGRVCMMATPDLLKNEPKDTTTDHTAEEKNNNGRKKMIGAVAVAGLTTAAGVYFASKGGMNFSAHTDVASHVTHARHAHNSSVSHKHSQKSLAPKAGHTHKSKLEARNKTARNVNGSDYLKARLPKGANLWIESVKELGKHASTEAVAKRDDLLLKLNHLTFTSARHMKVGYRYLYPR